MILNYNNIDFINDELINIINNFFITKSKNHYLKYLIFYFII